MTQMIRRLFIGVSLFLSLPLYSFSIIDSESYVKDMKNLPTFRRLYISAGPMDINLIQGGKSEVRIEGDKDQVDQMDVKVMQGELDITYKNPPKKGKASRVKVTITTKSLTGIIAKGAVSLSSSTMWKVSSLNFLLSGSGEFVMPVNAGSLRIQISGSSVLKLSGSAKSQNIAITGSGEYEGEGVKSNSATVVLSGAGSAHVFVKDTLDATIYGSGDVYYKGSPQIQSNVFGTGRVVKDDLL